MVRRKESEKKWMDRGEGNAYVTMSVFTDGEASAFEDYKTRHDS